MNEKKLFAGLIIIMVAVGFYGTTYSQNLPDSSKITIDRIFASGEFRGDRFSQARWIDDGNAYTKLERSEEFDGGSDIVKYNTKSGDKSILVAAADLVPEGDENPLSISNYQWSENRQMLLVFMNTRRVWRYNTKGDYWVLDLETKELKQLGEGLPGSSLMFAKFSPDNSKVAYVSKHNLYVEDLASGEIDQLTFDGTEDLINGTFDWAYEEEFFCRDGFRWSPNSKLIAYWQIDASGIKDFLMINNTDSLYSFTIPVEYPKVGEDPSSARIGVVATNGGNTRWMNIPGDPQQNYLVRMLWADNSKDFLVQQMNRKQNTNKIWFCKAETGLAANVYTDRDEAWLDLVEDWMWVDGEKYYTWLSENDGWRHLYLISKTGDEVKLITPGNYDVISIGEIDKKSGDVYFIASPHNPTQRYLYRIRLNGKSKAERITPEDQPGTHSYQIAPGGKYAFHTWSDINTPPLTELISLPNHKSIRVLVDNERLKNAVANLKITPAEFFRVTTADSIEMDGYMVKPPDFDPNKKYPVLFDLYGEPWTQTATDSWGSMWHYMLAQKGYIIMTMDNRGTPCLKGAEWRKSIYQNIGVLNSHDQAMATKEIIKWDFVDKDRIAVWGWSGGGSMTLNLMFRYPEIYKTGMAVAAVSNIRYYDNIYQERYTGIPQENPKVYDEGSPINFAKNLEGNLLIVHGTADDNVHYQNAEALILELIKSQKQFDVMPYPNCSHSIYEIPGARLHLFTLLTNYLMGHVEVGGK